MINEMICIGTSYTWGDGIDVDRNKNFVQWYKENTNEDVSRETHSFPAILEKLSGIKTRNLGKCGSSIEYVCRVVEELIESESLDDKILVLEYANWGRSELWSNKYKQYTIANWGPEDGEDVTNGYATFITLDYALHYEDAPHIYWDFRNEIEVYNKFCDSFVDENEILIKNDRQFLNLLYKLNHKNIKFVVIPLNTFYWNSLETDEILNNNLYPFKFGDDMGSYALGGWVAQKQYRIHDDIGGDCIESHPSPSGHKQIGKEIYEYLLTKNLL